MIRDNIARIIRKSFNDFKNCLAEDPDSVSDDDLKCVLAITLMAILSGADDEQFSIIDHYMKASYEILKGDKK